jgi:hypothetical protein
MAELTNNASTPDCIFGTKAGSNNCKSDATLSAGASHLCPLVYVRYKDHVFFKNMQSPKAEAIERETVGWVKGETDELLLLENDRAIPSRDKNVNGLIILKNCIVEAHPLLLQNNLKWVLNSAKPTVKDEYAFRPSERKTHSSKGERTK